VPRALPGQRGALVSSASDADRAAPDPSAAADRTADVLPAECPASRAAPVDRAVSARAAPVTGAVRQACPGSSAAAAEEILDERRPASERLDAQFLMETRPSHRPVAAPAAVARYAAVTPADASPASVAAPVEASSQVPQSANGSSAEQNGRRALPPREPEPEASAAAEAARIPRPREPAVLVPVRGVLRPAERPAAVPRPAVAPARPVPQREAAGRPVRVLVLALVRARQLREAQPPALQPEAPLLRPA
jgi:hypothetical protein